MTDKILKFVFIMLLTLLIWAWAFLSQEQERTYRGSLLVSATSRPDFLIQFEDNRSYVDLKLTFEGAPEKISELDKEYQKTKQWLTFHYNPTEEGITEPGTYVLELLDFIKRSPRAREFGLTVTACEPQQVEVQIDQLVKKELTVEVLDENGTIIKHEKITPARVDIYVRENESGQAVVIMTDDQINQARKEPIRQTPFVQIGGIAKRQFSEESVLIKLPETEPLQERVFQPRGIGFIISPSLKESYRVEILDENDLKTIKFRATQEAMDLYTQQQYHLLIQVNEGDENLDTIPARPVLFNFPQEMVRKGSIEAPSVPLTARIRLVPLSSGVN